MALGSERAIRSFVRRQGRLSAARREVLGMGGSDFRIAVADAEWSFPALFGRLAPVVLEIGFGMGESFLVTARAHPEWNHLGLEVHAPGVANVLQAVVSEGLSQVRVCQQDAVAALQQAVPLASLSRVNLFFPDPWPKARHHKRRLV